jgi:hypothetical protein
LKNHQLNQPVVWPEVKTGNFQAVGYAARFGRFSVFGAGYGWAGAEGEHDLGLARCDDLENIETVFSGG